MINSLQMQQLEESGEAVKLGLVGILSRPVYRIGDKVYRQYMAFDKTKNEYVPGDFYEVSPGAIENLIKILIKEG